MTYRVLGVDGYRKGWVGISLGEDGGSAAIAPTIHELVSRVAEDGALDVVAIDIPIGLPDTSRRACDLEARRILGKHASSVFVTPPRATLEQPDHAAAVKTNKKIVGEGVSKQAYGLRRRIFEVAEWLPSAPCRVVEIHPELSFTEMAGHPPNHSKARWAGYEERRLLLHQHGLRLYGELGEAGAESDIDDILDAAAAAWTAQRVAEGTARLVPEEPERFSDGVDCAIYV